MPQFDPVTGALVLPVWLSAAAAAVFVALAAVALARAGALRVLAALACVAVVGYLAWAGIDRGGNGEGFARQDFAQRADALMARALVPGSPLACLDADAGEPLALGCEKALFGSPETVAAAVTYVRARIDLLAEGVHAANRSGDAGYLPTLDALRRGLESDRFGIVAQVMAEKPNCKPEQCEGLALLHNFVKVRANLADKPFETLVARYSIGWDQSHGALTDSKISGAAPPPTGVPMSSKYDFPSAESIPPVSIMNPEPAPSPPAADKPPPKETAQARKPAPARAAPPRGAAAPKPPQQAPVPLAPAAQAPSPAQSAAE